MSEERGANLRGGRARSSCSRARRSLPVAVGPDPQIRIGVLGLFGSFLAQAAMRLDVFSLSTGGVNSSFEHGDEKSTMVKRSVCLFSTFRQHHPTSLTIFHRAKLPIGLWHHPADARIKSLSGP